MDQKDLETFNRNTYLSNSILFLAPVLILNSYYNESKIINSLPLTSILDLLTKTGNLKYLNRGPTYLKHSVILVALLSAHFITCKYFMNENFKILSKIDKDLIYLTKYDALINSVN